MMDDDSTIALVTSDFGQAWARNDFVQCISQNLIRLSATCCTKSHTTLGNMRGLRNRIAYNLGQHVAQNRIRLWARLDKIWYDVTNLKSHMPLSGS